ncbi:hypothetical protein PENVUL_c027G09919 [Penicillium vulpinum]|uniref:F-box domain-containing protein n=1 Tax=Penicillium vulpinum TaxID=29845 RepID=A0A1V6RUD8_9EURO|nr:hypothetical protein PENVUL_c027G09919 [Penicillium vulpinum]
MSITSLPVELVCEICGYLQLSELEAVRLTCCKLYRASLDTFADRYFKSIRFMATSEGLRNLEEIAKLEIVRERVQELWMIPAVFEGTDKDHRRSLGDYAVSSKSCQTLRGSELRARYAIYQTMVADNRSLVASEKFSTRLYKCMEKFKKLDTIGLANYTTPFLLDPRQQKIRFLGWRQLREKIDYRFSPRGLDGLTSVGMAHFNSMALLRILQAIRPHQQIRKLHACNYGAIISDFNVPQSQYYSILSILEDLEALHLSISPFGRPLSSDMVYWKHLGRGEPEPGKKSAILNWFNVIINVAPRLKVLEFSHGHHRTHPAKPNPLGELARFVGFTQLRELHLHWINFTSRTLILFLTTAKPTLRTLTLFSVTLDDGKDTAMEDDLHNTSDNSYTLRESPHWKRIWDFFRDELSLQRLSMSKISCDPRPCWISGLGNSSKPRETAEFDAKTAGISFNEWIGRLTPA